MEGKEGKGEEKKKDTKAPHKQNESQERYGKVSRSKVERIFCGLQCFFQDDADGNVEELPSKFRFRVLTAMLNSIAGYIEEKQLDMIAACLSMKFQPFTSKCMSPNKIPMAPTGFPLPGGGCGR